MVRETREYFTDADFCWLVGRRNHRCILPVRNQGDSNGCWAFVTVDTIYADLYWNTTDAQERTHIRPGSEQELIDHVHFYFPPPGSIVNEEGYIVIADGGLENNFHNAYYFVYTHGVCSVDEKPFLDQYSYPVEVPVRFSGRRIFLTDFDVQEAQGIFKDDLKELIKHRPIAAMIYCAPTFMDWMGPAIYPGPTEQEWRIFDETHANPNRQDYFGLHAVTIVGFGTENGVQFPNGIRDDITYLIAKNSWGTSWGYDGFIKIAIEFDFSSNRCNDRFFDHFAIPIGSHVRTVN